MWVSALLKKIQSSPYILTHILWFLPLQQHKRSARRFGSVDVTSSSDSTWFRLCQSKCLCAEQPGFSRWYENKAGILLPARSSLFVWSDTQQNVINNVRQTSAVRSDPARWDERADFYTVLQLFRKFSSIPEWTLVLLESLSEEAAVLSSCCLSS